MTSEQLADEIAKMVAETNHVSFAELMREWPDHFAYRGDDSRALMSPDNPNLLYWTGMSPIGAGAIDAVLARTGIELRPTQSLTYVIDGCMLSLPIAKTKHKYRTPHWQPATLCRAETSSAPVTRARA
jgi:hypothetical protein